MTSLRLRARVNFPANLTATGGIKVVKNAGTWTISPDFAHLTALTASQVTDPTTKQIWIYDPSADSYAVLTLAGLGDALYKLTSTTSNSIGTGPKTFATQTNKDVGVGQYVSITDDASPSTNFMFGQITAYSAGSLTVNVTATGGSGSYADWTIRVAGTTGATGSQGANAGFNYAFNSATSGDPGSGKFLFNNATFGSATQINISETDADGNGLATLLSTLDDGTSPNKCLMVFTKTGGVALFIAYITSTLTDNGAYDTYSITPVLTTGSISNADSFRAQFFRVGDQGSNGTLSVSGTPSAGMFGIWTNSTTQKGVSLNGIVRGNGASDPTVAGTSDTLTIGTIELGNASDTTFSRISAGVVGVEGVPITPNIPITSKSVAYTTVLADANTAIYHPSSDNNARTFTIDSNANVAYPVGTCLTFINDINTVTIAITTDTLVMAGTGSTGSRTLAANGQATAIKLASTRWQISGVGLT